MFATWIALFDVYPQAGASDVENFQKRKGNGLPCICFFVCFGSAVWKIFMMRGVEFKQGVGAYCLAWQNLAFYVFICCTHV
jgi:hypothetical protein